MARNFRRQRSAAQPIADLNVTNLIDLGFTLLIIFMVATPLIQQEQAVKVNLPVETVRPQAKRDEAATETITVNLAGEMFWGTRKVTTRELATLLGQANARQPEAPTIVVRGDAGSTYGQIMAAVDEVKKFPNLTKLDLQTQAKK